MKKIESFAGVGALIVKPNNTFFAITEQTSSLRTVKEAGMKSHPMESTEKDEHLPELTLARLFREEARIPGEHPQAIVDQSFPLCDVQVNSGLWVRMFGIDLPEDKLVVLGTHSHEVNNPQWIPMREMLQAPRGSNLFRAGVRETVLSYMNRGKATEIPQYPQTIDGPAIIARMEANQRKVLSQPIVLAG